jgi:hypothetical protein
MRDDESHREASEQVRRTVHTIAQVVTTRKQNQKNWEMDAGPLTDEVQRQTALVEWGVTH